MWMKEKWYKKKGVLKEEKWLEKRIGEGRIYKRSEKDGKWYVLRNEKMKDGEEEKKMV